MSDAKNPARASPDEIGGRGEFPEKGEQGEQGRWEKSCSGLSLARSCGPLPRIDHNRIRVFEILDVAGDEDQIVDDRGRCD